MGLLNVPNKIPRVLTADDRLTVENLDKMVASLNDRIDPKKVKAPVSEPLKKKVEKLKTRYLNQKAKTVKLYNRHKKALEDRDKSHPLGLRVSQLSVYEIYKRLDIKTNIKAMEATSGVLASDLVQSFLKHPVENTMLVAGAGLAIGGFLGTPAGQQVSKFVWEKVIKNTFTTLFGNGPAVAVLASGVGIFAAACVMKIARKRMEQSALLKQEVEEKLHEGTERDETSLSTAFDVRKADLIQKAASGLDASTNETYQYLLKVTTSPDYSPDMKRNAMIILREADKQRAGVVFEQTGFKYEQRLEKADIADALKASVNIEKASVKVAEPSGSSITDPSVKTKFDDVVSKVKEAYKRNKIDFHKSVDQIIADAGADWTFTYSKDKKTKELQTKEHAAAQAMVSEYVKDIIAQLQAKDFCVTNGLMDKKGALTEGDYGGIVAKNKMDRFIYEQFIHGGNSLGMFKYVPTDPAHVKAVEEFKAKYGKFIQNAYNFNLEKDGLVK